MKKIIILLLAIIPFLFACGQANVLVDYQTDEALEADLNRGIDCTGKVVTISVDKIVPDSAFGYNIQSGEHLNFCSSEKVKAKVGGYLTVKITKVRRVLGSYIIYYEKIK